jgi:hypothetical protein
MHPGGRGPAGASPSCLLRRDNERMTNGEPAPGAGPPGAGSDPQPPGAGSGPQSLGGSEAAGRAPAAGGGPGRGLAPRHPVWHSLVHQAADVEQATARRLAAESAHLPAWQRRTRGEHRWPVSVAIIVAVVLQMLLPGQMALRPLPPWLLPALEVGLLAGLAIANPIRIERRSRFVRFASLGLILIMTAANAASAVILVRLIITDPAATGSAAPLLATGAAIWATNVIAFALWYWEFDRGGPVHRAQATYRYLDFLFPQMTLPPELTHPDWEPRFADYLYLAFTNATAFSPTDVMPLARWAKFTMAVQSMISLALAALVIARAVNILR